jgi:hypothetical protein
MCGASPGALQWPAEPSALRALAPQAAGHLRASTFRSARLASLLSPRQLSRSSGSESRFAHSSIGAKDCVKGIQPKGTRPGNRGFP